MEDTTMQKRILLIDDEDSLRRSLSLGLSQSGYEVEPCENGISALKKLEQYQSNKMQFDSIILDIKLPDINGITLGKMISAKYPGVLIFLITGFMERYNKEDVKKMNIQELVEKPFTAEELGKKIELALKARKDIPAQPKETVLPSSKARVSSSAYALVKLKENADFMDAYRELYFHKNTLYCDATNGAYDMVILFQDENIEKCREFAENKVKKMSMVDSVEMLEIKKPVMDENVQKILEDAEIALSKEEDTSQKSRDLGKGINSYIFLEIEKEKLDFIYPVLSLNEDVVFCDYTSGKYNIVLFVHGNHFNQIDNFVEEKIMPLEGILKVKKFPVVNLIGM